MNDAIKANNTELTVENVGCSIGELKRHIESTWEPEMTWDNYGPEWEIDHIVPIKYGDNVTIEETIKRLHWTNTQAMWGPDNNAKGNRFIGKKRPTAPTGPAPANQPMTNFTVQNMTININTTQ